MAISIADLLESYPFPSPLLLPDPHLYNLYVDALLRQKHLIAKDDFIFRDHKRTPSLGDTEDISPMADTVSRKDLQCIDCPQNYASNLICQLSDY